MGGGDAAFVIPLMKCLLNKRYYLWKQGKFSDANVVATKINVYDLRGKKRPTW